MSPKPKRRGRAFEELIGRLERLASRGRLTLASPHYARDLETNERREIDIAILGADGSLQVMIECRDWKKKVSSTWIEQLYAKAKSVGAPKTIAVSRSGFFKPALDKARAWGIETRVIEDITDDDLRSWMPTVSIAQVRMNVELLPVLLALYDERQNDLVNGVPVDELVFVTESGEQRLTDLIKRIVKKKLPEHDEAYEILEILFPGLYTPRDNARLHAMLLKETLGKTEDGTPMIWQCNVECDPGYAQLRTPAGDVEAKRIGIRYQVELQLSPAHVMLGKYVGPDGNVLRGFAEAHMSAPDLGVPDSGVTISIPGPDAVAPETDHPSTSRA